MRIRTGYSFKHSVGHIKEVAERLKNEVGWKVAPISDRMSTFGFVRWKKLCEQMELRPIFGVELPVVAVADDKKSPVDFWTFFAKDELRPLHDLVSLATKSTGLSYEEATKAKGVIKITGERCLLDRVKPNVKDLYVGLAPGLPVGLYREAKKRGFKFLATSNNNYTRETDKDFYRVAIGMRANSASYAQHILDDNELKAQLWFADPKDIRAGLANREACMASCKATLRRATLLSPEKKKTLRQLCLDGAKTLGVNVTNNREYAERLNKELAMIEEKKFEDYFFIIADMMKYARTKMVVGPARGSSCGSLVCYLLGITSVDPIPYNLVFERFIDRTRADLPDIDLDFSDERRHFAIDYMAEKYGRPHVARLGSVSMHQSKSALNLIGIGLKIPQWQINEVSNTVVKRSMGDSRAGSTIYDTLHETDVGKKMLKDFPNAEIAARLEDHPSNSGQHAAGIVLTQDEVTDFVAIDMRTGAAMCDKYDAEDLNLLKIDMLGLTQLSIFERVLELIGRSEERNHFFESIPLDDQRAFDQLNALKFSGIFQFTPGSALANLVRGMIKNNKIRLNHIEDLIALTALVRPGPLGSGMTDSWVKRRAGQEKVSYAHPLLEEQLKSTLGLVVYQEQIMNIGREVGDLTWDDVTALRKAMSKSLGKEYFDQFGDRWKRGAIQKGMPEVLANEFWDQMCQFGMWSFNRSHSVAYGLVSYWCCWLKAHYPVEFAAATLDAETTVDRQVAALREMKEEGVEYVPIDPDRSIDRWTIAEEGANRHRFLVGPLQNIHGIGPAAVAKIMQSRKDGSELPGAIKKKLEHAKTPIDTVTPIGDRIKFLHPDLPSEGIVTKPTSIGTIGDDQKEEEEVLILAKVNKIQPLDENETSRVAKRGRKVTGPTKAINMFFADDTGEIFAKISRYEYDRIGKDIASQARAGKSLFAVKGTVPQHFRMIWINKIRYLGELE